MINYGTSNFIQHGQITVSGTPVQLPNVDVNRSALIICASGSTNTVYIGSSGVTAVSGWPLVVNAAVSLPVQNLNMTWVVTSPNFLADVRWLVN